MEGALRIALVLAVAAFALWVPKYLHDHPVEAELARLDAEVQRLRAANQALVEENQQYRTLVRGLREDPRILDRRARETLGMSRSDELIIWFDEAAGVQSSESR